MNRLKWTKTKHGWEAEATAGFYFVQKNETIHDKDEYTAWYAKLIIKPDEYEWFALGRGDLTIAKQLCEKYKHNQKG